MLRPEHIEFKVQPGLTPWTVMIVACPSAIRAVATAARPPGGQVDNERMAKQEAMQILWEIFYREFRQLYHDMCSAHHDRAMHDPTRFDHEISLLTRMAELLRCPIDKVPPTGDVEP